MGSTQLDLIWNSNFLETKITWGSVKIQIPLQRNPFVSNPTNTAKLAMELLFPRKTQKPNRSREPTQNPDPSQTQIPNPSRENIFLGNKQRIKNTWESGYLQGCEATWGSCNQRRAWSNTHKQDPTRRPQPPQMPLPPPKRLKETSLQHSLCNPSLLSSPLSIISFPFPFLFSSLPWWGEKREREREKERETCEPSPLPFLFPLLMLPPLPPPPYLLFAWWEKLERNWKNILRHLY